MLERKGLEGGDPTQLLPKAPGFLLQLPAADVPLLLQGLAPTTHLCGWSSGHPEHWVGLGRKEGKLWV